MILVAIMKRLIGYVVAVVGIAVMVLGFGMFDLDIEILKGVSSNYIAGIGIVAVIVGVVISLRAGGSGKVSQSKEEVPIYEGTGKNRKIVGYRKG
jgi:hypothetical protein